MNYLPFSYATGNTGNAYTLTTPGFAYKIGVMSKYRFHENFNLHSEINFIDTVGLFGYQEEDDSHSFHFSCIEMPLLLQMSGKSRVRWYVETGISLKYLFKAEYAAKYKENEESKERAINGGRFTFEVDDGNTYYYVRDSAENYFNRFMVTALVGTGIMIKIWRFTLSFGSRAGYDLIPVGKNMYDVNNVHWTFDKVRLLHLELLYWSVMYNF